MPTRPPRPTHDRRWRRGCALALATALLLTSCAGSDGDGGGDAQPATTTPRRDTGGGLDAGGLKPAGTIATDSGFRVDVHGFAFQNYGNDAGYPNLDARALQTLFGDQVCASTEGGTCKLTAPADEWMKAQNDGMDGGHCMGMATLAWMLFDRTVDPAVFGGPNAAALKIENNPELSHAIARAFVSQDLSPGADAKTEAPPNATIDKLKAGWAAKQGFVLGFFKKDAKGEVSGGHATTPIAIEDRGDGKVGIVMYDNNYPNEPQVMLVDPETDTWSYSTAADPRQDPDAYTGGADNPLELYPVAALAQPQACPFCAPDAAPAAASVGTGLGAARAPVAPENRYVQVYLNQNAGASGVEIDIVGSDGNPLPGVVEDYSLSKFSMQAIPPVLKVPKNAAFTIKVDGSKLTQSETTDIQLIGPGYDVSVDEISLNPGQTDTIEFNPAGTTVTYTTSGNESPTIGFGLDGTDDVSYAFDFNGVEMGDSGGKLTAALDQNAKTVRVASQASEKSSVGFTIERIAPTDEDGFNSDGIELDPGHALIVNYGVWKGSGSPIPVGVDTNGDGQPDEQLEVAPK